MYGASKIITDKQAQKIRKRSAQLRAQNHAALKSGLEISPDRPWRRTSGNCTCLCILFKFWNIKIWNIKFFKLHKYVYKDFMKFICNNLWKFHRLIFNKHMTTWFILFICLHIFEQHNYVSVCHYFISPINFCLQIFHIFMLSTTHRWSLLKPVSPCGCFLRSFQHAECHCHGCIWKASRLWWKQLLDHKFSLTTAQPCSERFGKAVDSSLSSVHETWRLLVVEVREEAFYKATCPRYWIGSHKPRRDRLHDSRSSHQRQSSDIFGLLL